MLFRSQEGHIGIAQLLLTHGANIRAQYQNGWTPLHLAAQEGHEALAQLLIEHGAVLEAQNEQGFTPLHSAVFSGQFETVKVLLQAGANPMTKDQDGQTPQQLALTGHHLNMSTLFLDGEKEMELLLDTEEPEDFVMPHPTPSAEIPVNAMPAIDTIPDNQPWNRV